MGNSQDVFNRDSAYPITSKGVNIRVTSNYPSNTFGKDDNVNFDNSINCDFPHAVEDFNLQCKSVNNQCYYGLSLAFLSVFSLVYIS
ncbi:hypothetical protein TVAG_043510 [Trichomonas vaginalis G3]|uniref:Uncharacterized protein n=1 Tax=Trichomonas vaginalis (strain ATCC PRA-98 / G3) TaxID=412133 RepID=A2EV91_TRIV3|nr:hypothetical protein TVAG_043510 [Trichomonas vaginalis G3]|eukprot:XP_001315628.1 hypothetical protein [Trichomonas vaginalis G3]